MTKQLADVHLTGDSQCFPFYTYDEDGTNRQENITDWALVEFRDHYGNGTISKWDIFHYNYGLLHQPTYREKYEMNLKRDLPHIPFAEDFWGFATAGAEVSRPPRQLRIRSEIRRTEVHRNTRHADRLAR